MNAQTLALSAALLGTITATASAQWNPALGQYGKEVSTDLRVMTWNVADAIVSSSNRKSQAVFSNWDAIARIIADLQPDVLIIQEAGDRSGNSSGSGVDTVAQLERTFEQLIEGGLDEFNGNAPIAHYVQLHAPDYDLPFKFASTSTDGFNRNVILSRYPFVDLNGDCVAERSSFVVLGDGPAFGNGGIRDFATAEIDLPDDIYAHDVVVGNSHLKSGGSSSDISDRLNAAENISAYIRNFWDGRLSGEPDPENFVNGTDAVRVLIEGTPVIYGGDWNEDHLSNGFPGAPETMVQNVGGFNDGPDRDGSDNTFDDARQINSTSDATLGGSKLDYIGWQDSQVEGVRREFVFNSAVSGLVLPAAVAGYPIAPTAASTSASDHRPVVVDFILETVEPGQRSCDRIDLAAPFGVLDLDDIDSFIANFSTCAYADLVAPFGVFDLDDVDAFIVSFFAGCP